MTFSHTFVICAFGESEYLETCIRSLQKQTTPSTILMTAPCSNPLLTAMAEKYNIPLYIRGGEANFRDDWNFAYQAAETEWVTLAHQDDIYRRRYTEALREKIRQAGREAGTEALAFTTDYIPIRNGKAGPRDKNSRIRRLLRTPLKNSRMAESPFWKKAVLSCGNSICCPTVAYHKKILEEPLFTSDLRFNIDWDTFLDLARRPGRILYADQPLVYYRVYAGAASMRYIASHQREEEDRIMFRKFWPAWMVPVLMHFYKKAYDTYRITAGGQDP